MIRSLHHVGFTVPDLEVGRQFYKIFGLNDQASGNDLVLRCADRDQDQQACVPPRRAWKRQEYR